MKEFGLFVFNLFAGIVLTELVLRRARPDMRKPYSPPRVVYEGLLHQ